MNREWWRLEETEADLGAGVRNATRVFVVFWVAILLVAGIVYVVLA